MATIFIVYNAKDAKSADDYEKYLKEKKVPFVRSQPFVKSYDIYRMDKVLAPPGVSNLPYQFVAKLEISDLGLFAKAMQTPEMHEFVSEYRAYLEADPNKWVMGHKIEPVT